MSEVGSNGNYWSSTAYAYDTNIACSVYFIAGNVIPENYYYRHGGFSVRLVRVAE